MLEDFAPEIPDYALDMHTMKGKAMGRGLDHFRSEGAKLVPFVAQRDCQESLFRFCAALNSRTCL